MTRPNVKGPAQLAETYGPDFMARHHRRHRERVQVYEWRLTLPYPVERQELVRLLGRRFPHFSIDERPIENRA